MKRFTLLIAALAAVFAVGCSDTNDDTPGPGPGNDRKPVWESYTHAQLLRLKGNVEQLRTEVILSEADGGGSLLQLLATFDATGNCTAYDPTGIEFEEPALRNKGTRDWGISAARYTYAYDAAGRLASATKYDVGSDPVTYTVTYGTHETYIPAPFPLGDIEPFLLRGATRIETEGYLLTSDGISATATVQTVGWPSTIQETTWTIADSQPIAGLTIVYANNSGNKGDELWRESTEYTYDRNWLTFSEVVKTQDDDDSQRSVTHYSMQWPCSPTVKEGYIGNNTEPEYRMVYEYAENGQPKRAKYTLGMYFDTEFEQHFTAYDDAGNWTAAIRKQDGAESQIRRDISYY